MHPVTVRYDVQRARASGLSAAWVLTTYGVPTRTQQRMLHESIRFGMTDHDFHEQHPVGRPTALSDAHRRLLAVWLAQEPQTSGVQFLQRLTTEHGYRGGKTAFYDYLAKQPRPKPGTLPVVRFEGVRGEFAQHDFGTLTVRYLDGTEEKLTFYAGRLKYSRALHVCLVSGENTEAFVRGMEAFAASLGGLPLLNVVDNSKAAVLKRWKDPDTGERKIQLQRDLGSFLAEVGVLAEPTAPYSGNQKGSVENLVRFVKENFLTPRQFRNREHLEEQLGVWLRWVNRERKCDATGVIPAERLAEEAGYLKPVPFGEDGYGLLRSAIVGRDGWVRFRGKRYSAPAAWLGQVVEVRVYRHAVVLCYQGERIRHPREPRNGRYSLLPEHQAPLFVKPRGAVMLKRQIMMDDAPVVEAFFTELVHRRPDTWRAKDLPVLWLQREAWGPEVFVAAIASCVAAGTYGSEYVAAWRERRQP
jgi:transposase